MKSIINSKLSETDNINNWKKKGNIYEVIRIIDSKPLFLKEHLLRLKSSDCQIDIDLIEDDIWTLINSFKEGLNDNIFISVNNSTYERGIFIINGFYPPKEWYEEGIEINTYTIRRTNPNLKIYDVDYKKSIEEHLRNTKVFETLITDDGIINEGSRSNVFFINKNLVYTPSIDTVLPGITRDKVFEAARNCGIVIYETMIYLKDLKNYDGAFITGTSIDLLPVVKIDKLKLDTVNSSCFKLLMSEFTKIKNKDLE